MNYCYFNNGMSWRLVAADYVALSGEVLFAAPPTASQLAASFAGYAAAAGAALVWYATRKQATIAAGGISVNVAASGSPQNVECSTDPTSLTLLQGAYSLALANSGATFNWVTAAGAAVTLSAAQVQTIFNAVTTFIQSTFATLASVIAAINNGTITSTAQIDSPPSGVTAWPVNS